VAIGQRHAAEQIGEAREVARARRVESIERLDQIAQRRRLLSLTRVLDAEPREQLPDAHSPGFLAGV
jgi:hypothetical protein